MKIRRLLGLALGLAAALAIGQIVAAGGKPGEDVKAKAAVEVKAEKGKGVRAAAFIEAFNGRLRAECLNAHWFLTLADAREKLEDWRKDYNEVRPHGAIGNRPPVSLMTPAGASSPPT